MATIVTHALNRQYEGSKTLGGGKERVEHYDIGFDSAPDDEGECYTHEDSPRLQTPHRNDPTLIVTNLNATSVDGVKFDLAVTYSRVKLEDQTDNPLTKPAVITARTVQRNVLRWLDPDGKAYRNKAGDRFAREVQESLIVISVLKNLPSDPWQVWLLNLRDSINQSALRIKGQTLKKRTVRYDNIVIPNEIKFPDEEKFFVPATFELTYRPEGWRGDPLNEGFYELEEIELTEDNVDAFVLGPDARIGDKIKRRKEILDGQGKALREPVFLDRNGAAYRNNDKQNSLRADLLDSEIIVLDVKDYRETNLSVLPIR